MFKNFQKGISIAILVVFLVASIKSPSYAQLSQDSMPRLPAPGSMVNLSQAYVPVLIRGITFDSKDPFKFNFIIDTGNSGLRADNPQLKHESTKLIKYFLAALTIPEHDLWVNLSPYEKARMLPDSLRQTGMGRDMLAQDYLLKQVTASLIYPQKKLGREFWNKVYAKAQAEYGTTQIPVNTYNKVWIVADKADVFERNQSAFVMDAHLKVMLNEDYLAMKEHKAIHNDTDSIGSKIVRQIVLPELEKEVNTGKNFAPVRQMFYSMILASWYKMALKKAVVNQLYADKNKVGVGIAIEDKTTAYKIYERYIQAYKKGVFNYISEEDVNGRSVPRKYFSGGLRILPNPAMIGRHRDVKSALAALTSFVGSAVLVSTALLTGLQNAGAQSAGVINFPPSEFQGIDSQGHALSFHPPDPKNLNYGFVVNGSNLWGQYYFYPASGTNEAGAQGILVVEPDDSNLPMTVAPVNLTQESIPAGVFTVDRGVYWNNQKAVLSFALKNNPNTATAQSEVAALKSSGFTSGNGFVAPSKSGGLNISSVVNGFLQLEALKSTVVPTGTIFSDQNNRVNFQLSALGGSYSIGTVINSTAVTNIPGVRAFYQATVSGKTNSFVPAGVYSYGVMTAGGQIIPLLLSVTDSPATVNGFLNIFAQAISGNVSAREQLSNILLSDNSNTYSQLLLMSAFTSAMDLNLYIIGADATPFFSRMNAWGNSTYQMAQQQPRTSDATLDLTLYNVVVEQWLSTYNLLPMLIAKNDFSDLNALTYNLGKLQSVVPYNGDPNPTIDQNIAGALSNTSAAINSQIVISNNGRINFQLSGFNGNYALGPNTQAQSVTNIPGISAFFQASIPGINNSFVPSGTYSYGVVTTGGIRISLVFSQSDNPSTVYSFLGIFYKAISGDVTAQQQLTNTLLNDTSNTYSQLLLMSAYTSAMELGLNISGTDSTPFFTRINAWGNSGISTEDYMSAALFGALVDQWLASYPSTFNQIATSPDKTDFNLVNGSFDTLLIPQYGNMDPIAGELYTFLDGISHRISSASQAMITIPSKPLTAAVKSTRKPLIKEQTPLGGIDFDRSYMQMRVFKKGNGVQMKFDPALVAKMKHDGFAGFIPFIVNMQTISNLNEFIGFKEEHS